jgi:hypothetical protein
LVNLSGVAIQSVTWNSGASGNPLENLQAGTYSYTLTDVFGCTANGSLVLFDPDPLFVLLTPVGATAQANGSLSWTVFGGVPPFEVSVDDEPVTGTMLAGLEPGIYQFDLVDSQGCTFSEEVVITGSASVPEQGLANTRVFPNPAKDRLQFSSTVLVRRVVALDGRGRVVLDRSFGTREGVLDVSGLAQGAYVLELHGAESVSRARFVKSW